jgi:hypothetical protein
MRMTRLGALLVCALVCLWGCGHDTEGHGHTDHESGHESGHDETLVVGVELTLNEGKKWSVDEHTRNSAARITELVAAVEDLQSIEQSKELAAELDKELNGLIQGCTMTGAAHEQLHVFLVAFLPQVGALKEGEDVHALRETREQIASLLVAYEEHFE